MKGEMDGMIEWEELQTTVWFYRRLGLANGDFQIQHMYERNLVQ